MYEANPNAIYPADWSSTDSPGDRAGYVSLEKSEVYAATAQGAFDLAGLGKVVKVSIGSYFSRAATHQTLINSLSSAARRPIFDHCEKHSTCPNHSNST
jgi:hypothetical protein